MKAFKKIILAGGSGQMGSAIKKHFAEKAEEIIILSRNAKAPAGNVRTLQWDGATAGDWWKELEDADFLVNLAGKNVNCRYNETNKREIMDSRVNSVRALSAAIKKCGRPPKLWIQCASATIYRHAEDRPMTEADTETGTGFSEEVCKAWEGAFWNETKDISGMRKVVLRTTLVLGKTEGVFPRMENLVRFGLGGRQGNGKQMMSWVHEDDVAGMIDWIVGHKEIEGPVNCGSPQPLSNENFMKIVRKVYGMPFGIPAPVWLLEIGAWLIRTETELLLKSRWVLPEKLQDSGYEFKYPALEKAVAELKGTS